MEKPKAAILVRVSTKKQDSDRQKHDLVAEAGRRGWEVVEIVEEVISGLSEADDRKGLARISDLARRGRINKVMVHEITRVARLPSVIHGFVEHLTGCGVSLYYHQQSLETLTAQGNPNAMAQLMIAILAGLAKNETDVLSDRIRSGMEGARRNGVRIGRPKGKWDDGKFRARYSAVIREIERHPEMSNGRLALLGGVSVSTVIKIRRFLREPVEGSSGVAGG
jgi:DNA invertase Pin-like site-specific DNA recombinase